MNDTICKCWRCGEAINDEHPSDGGYYASNPPQYAHKVCPNRETTTSPEPRTHLQRLLDDCNVIETLTEQVRELTAERDRLNRLIEWLKLKIELQPNASYGDVMGQMHVVWNGYQAHKRHVVAALKGETDEQ